MRSEEFFWRDGEVVYWEMDSLRADRPPIEQADELKEDLAQIRYPGDVFVDVGWYPEFSASGKFVVSVIADGDWDAPLFREEARTMEAMISAIRSAVEKAADLSASV